MFEHSAAQRNARLKQHSEIIDGVRYALTIGEEDMPVRGNAIFTGDAEEDRKHENEILERLDRGNLWAWCVVTVTASIEYEGERFEGDYVLGSCSYRDAADFMAEGGYYRDMLSEARKALALALDEARRRGQKAQSAIRILDGFAARAQEEK